MLQVLMAVAPKLKNCHVRWFTDNQNVARILQVGSKKPWLHAEAIRVFSLSVQHQIRLELGWIRRHLTERADYLSHIVDWQLNPAPHSVDRFASFHNCQLQRFNSQVLEPRV